MKYPSVKSKRGKNPSKIIPEEEYKTLIIIIGTRARKIDTLYGTFRGARDEHILDRNPSPTSVIVIKLAEYRKNEESGAASKVKPHTGFIN